MASNKLTSKQENFCQLVAEGETYSGAYRKAYDVGAKTKKETIWRKSSELMDNGKVSARVDEIKKDAIKRGQITIDQVLEQLRNWLLFDPIELIDETTEAVKSLKDMSKEARMSLAEITVTEIWGMNENPDGKKIKEKTGELKKIKFIDKRATADMFMKKFGEYMDNTENTTSQLELIKEIVEGIKK